MRKHFYEDSGYPQCQQKCVVRGGSVFFKVCICELVGGHEGSCERIPTTRWASVNDFQRWPVYRNFVSSD